METKQLKFEKFTLNYSPGDDGFYRVTFSDCTFGRGTYKLSMGKHYPVIKFSSVTCPAWQSGTIYMPGTSRSRDNDIALIPNIIIDRLINILNGEDIEIDQDVYFARSFTKATKHYHIPYKPEIKHSDYYMSQTCKESMLCCLISPSYIDKTQKVVYICEKFTPEQIQYLRDIQRNIAVEDHIILTQLNENILKVECPNWWLTQGYYRLGWFFLHARLANQRETIDAKNKHFLDAFENGKFNISDVSYRQWSGSYNWRYAFTHTDYLV